MKAFNYMKIFTLAAMTVACNEKITPKLIDANQSTTVPPVIKPEEYYLRVKNISPANRKYHLHRSGPGNHFTNCEIKSTMMFDSLLYKNPATRAPYDIHCMFEAEELDLQQKGFSFQFEASPNTCEYVGYSPFSFFNFKPGNSSATYRRFNCEEGVNETNIPNRTERLNLADGPINCGRMGLVDDDIPSNQKVSFKAPADYQKLCKYDYSTQSKNPGPNCDVGVITVEEYTFTFIPGEDGGQGTIDISDPVYTTVECNGSVAACISGPIKKEEDADDKTSVITVYRTEVNEPFSEKRVYENSSKKWGTLYYSNFRRNLANPHIEYGAQPKDSPVLFEPYARAFEGYSNIFTSLMENYAAGKSYNGLAGLSGVTTDDHVYNTFGYIEKRGISYAAEPFIGATDEETEEEYRTSPYYTFYCLDAASEIKARIKLTVRDWDRAFDKDRDFGLFDIISDAYLGNDLARIDNPFGNEFEGDHDPLNKINDFPDWDDIIPMERSAGGLDGFTTWWRPIAGFNNNATFPQIQVSGDN